MTYIIISIFRIHHVVDVNCKMGGVQVLTDEEETSIANYLFKMAEANFPLSRKEIGLEIKGLLDKHSRKTRFKDNMPGRFYWVTYYLSLYS